MHAWPFAGCYFRASICLIYVPTTTATSPLLKQNNDVLITGFDSAWGDTSEGAACDIELSTDRRIVIQDAPIAVTWEMARSHVLRLDVAEHLIAIDQPTVVANATGSRPVDIALARALMRDFKLGAHAANTGNTACFGADAGIWRFLDVLDGRGYKHNPSGIATRTVPKGYFECYPHLALIGLFSLKERLAYKARDANIEAWKELLRLVRSLDEGTPAVENVKDVFPLTLAHSKTNENAIDAFICGYIAAYLHVHRLTLNVIIGSLTTGYMVTPVNASLHAALRSCFSEHDVNPIGEAARTRPSSAPVPSEPAAVTPHQSGWSSATFTCTDPANVWGNVNPWLTRFTNGELLVRFTHEPDRPTIRFISFSAQGNSQKGMKIAPSPSNRERWKLLADGASRRQPKRFHVEYSWIAS